MVRISNSDEKEKICRHVSCNCGRERVCLLSIHKREDLAIQIERHSHQIKFTVPTPLRSHDDVPHCSDTSTKGLLRDAWSDVQEVLEDGMEGKVGEGRKEGNGNNLMASDIYICNDPESTLNENQLCTAPH